MSIKIKLIVLVSLITNTFLFGNYRHLLEQAPPHSKRHSSELCAAADGNLKSLLNEEYKLLNYLYKYYDSETGSWIDYYRYTPFYYENELTDRLLVDIKNYTTFNWGEYYLYDYTYDFNDNQSAIMMYSKGEQGWINDFSEGYEYNDDNQLTFFSLRYWDGSAWQNDLDINYYYEEGKLIREEWIRYNRERSTTHYRGLYERNAEGLVVSEVWEILWESNWYPYTKADYTYDDGLLQEELWSDLIEASWQLTLMYQYFYVNNLRSSIIGSVRSEDGMNWINSVKHNYSYLDERYLVEYLYREWSEQNSVWQDIYKYNYYWQPPTGIESRVIEPRQTTELHIFPNPFTTETIISLTDHKNTKDYQVELYDIRGRKVDSFKVARIDKVKGRQWQVTLTANKPNGIYFFRVNSEHESYTGKVLIIR